MLRAPYKWHSRQPIFTTDSASGARPIVFGEDSRCSSELRTFYLAAHGAGRDSDLRIIPEAFVFSGVASRHHVQLAILFSKPDRRAHNRAVLLKGAQRNVLLTMNLGWDRHENIVRKRTQLPENS